MVPPPNTFAKDSGWVFLCCVQSSISQETSNKPCAAFFLLRLILSLFYFHATAVACSPDWLLCGAIWRLMALLRTWAWTSGRHRRWWPLQKNWPPPHLLIYWLFSTVHFFTFFRALVWSDDTGCGIFLHSTDSTDAADLFRRTGGRSAPASTHIVHPLTRIPNSSSVLCHVFSCAMDLGNRASYHRSAGVKTTGNKF